MSDVIAVADLEETKKHNTFHVDVMTGRTGDYATNAVTGQVQKTLPATIRDIDWSLVGKFADGVTFTKQSDFALDASNTQWIYVGASPFPVVVPAGTVPSAPDYQVVHVGSLQALSGLTEPSDLAQRHRIKTTVAEIATGVFKDGDLLEVSDMGNGSFNVRNGGTANGFDVLSASAGKTAGLVGRSMLDGLGVGYGLMQQLSANRRDSAILVMGDSTGNEATEWVYKVALKLAAAYPAYSVDYYLWNDGTGDYDAPTSLSTGSGSFRLKIYNGSVAGSTTQYFMGSRRQNLYAGQSFDLIIQNYGHNGASTSALNVLIARITESVAQVVADNPTSEVVLTLQNIDTSLEDFSNRQVEATKIVANNLGLATLDIRSVFRWKQAQGTLAEWMADVVHPNSIGSDVWANYVFRALKNSDKFVSQNRNPLSSTIKTRVVNPFFADWMWSSATPFGYGVSAATTTKELTIKETGSWSAKCSGTTTATGSIIVPLTPYLANRPKGSSLYFMARIYVPSSNATTNPGRLQFDTNLGSVILPAYPEAVDGWTWRLVRLPASLLDGATTLNAYVYTGNNADIIYIDRINVVSGEAPVEPLFEVSTLSGYYDPSNVGVKNTNVVNVVNDSVTMASTSEAFPSFYINVYGMVPNETYTMKWTYVGGGSGTAAARAGLNDSGTIIAQVNPLSTGSLSWKPTVDSGSIQISNSAGTTPFTLNSIKITKG